MPEASALLQPGGSSAAMIHVEGLAKAHYLDAQRIDVFANLSFSIQAGEFVALMGESGAGKSSLLHVLACLDNPSAGVYELNRRRVSELSELHLAAVRNALIGTVFQTSHFVDHLDLVDNVALPGLYASPPPTDAIPRAQSLLARVGLAHRLRHLPAMLSGGERQRAAIARALFNNPLLLLADEPTGNLDADNSQRVMALLRELNSDGLTIFLVTHDESVAAMAGRVISLVDGGLHERAR